MSTTPRFSGKTVIITGASAGIGSACARLFAAEGANLVLAARRPGPLEALANTLETETLVVPTDVASHEACVNLIDAAVERFGRIDVLVNNAGLHHRGDFDTHDASRFADMIDVNLKAPIVLTRLALEHLEGVGGVVVNVASIAGFVPLPGAAVYSSTKFGLRAFSRALAVEMHERGVRSTVVSPGPVSTGFILDEIDTVSPLVFSQPMSTAEEVAALVIACAADGELERAIPQASALLATVGYLFPSLHKLLIPILKKRGEAAREAIKRDGF